MTLSTTPLHEDAPCVKLSTLFDNAVEAYTPEPGEDPRRAPLPTVGDIAYAFLLRPAWPRAHDGLPRFIVSAVTEDGEPLVDDDRIPFEVEQSSDLATIRTELHEVERAIGWEVDNCRDRTLMLADSTDEAMRRHHPREL